MAMAKNRDSENNLRVHGDAQLELRRRPWRCEGCDVAESRTFQKSEGEGYSERVREFMTGSNAVVGSEKLGAAFQALVNRSYPQWPMQILHRS